MKTCIRCGLLKELGEFYKHPQMADGHLNKCKQCCLGYAKQERVERGDVLRERDRKRNMAPHRVAARFEYSQTQRGKNTIQRIKKAWADRNPRKRAAQILFRNRQRYDKSLAPQPCVKCGARAHGHHENYDKPLEVVWLCPQHHKDRHKEMKKEGIEP